jgi:hypothetical protein
MTKHTPSPDPEPEIDYAAAFAELDAKEAAKQSSGEKKPPDQLEEIRVQFRGAHLGDMGVLELRVGDTVVFIESGNLAFIASALPNLGVDGNTLVTWGYLPPEEKS